MKKIRLLILPDGNLSMGGEVRAFKLREYLKTKAGKWFEGEVDDRESAEMRKFFEGPVTHAWYYLNPLSRWKDFTDARESLKMEFNSYAGRNHKGERVMYAKSTMMSSKAFSAFLDRIQAFFEENGYEDYFPNPEHYKKWRDTHPTLGDESYPPTLALRDMYRKELGFD